MKIGVCRKCIVRACCSEVCDKKKEEYNFLVNVVMPITLGFIAIVQAVIFIYIVVTYDELMLLKTLVICWIPSMLFSFIATPQLDGKKYKRELLIFGPLMLIWYLVAYMLYKYTAVRTS